MKKPKNAKSGCLPPACSATASILEYLQKAIVLAQQQRDQIAEVKDVKHATVRFYEGKVSAFDSVLARLDGRYSSVKQNATAQADASTKP